MKNGSVPSHLGQQQMVLVITPERTSHRGDAEHLTGIERPYNKLLQPECPGYAFSRLGNTLE